jgi:hypothetical protein
MVNKLVTGGAVVVLFLVIGYVFFGAGGGLLGKFGQVAVTEGPGMFLGFPQSECRDNLIADFPAVTLTPPDLVSCQSQGECGSGTFCCVEQSTTCKTYDNTKYDETILSDKAFLDKHKFLRITIPLDSHFIGFDDGEVIFYDEENVIYRWEGNFDTEGNIKIDELVDLGSDITINSWPVQSFDEGLIVISYRDSSYNQYISIINTQDPQNYVTIDTQDSGQPYVSGEYIVWGSETLNRWKYGEYNYAGEPDILVIDNTQRVSELTVGRNGEMIWALRTTGYVNRVEAYSEDVKTIYWDGYTYEPTGAPSLLTFSEDIITVGHIIDDQGNVYLSARESSTDGIYTNYYGHPIERRGVQKWDGRTYDESGKPNFEYLFSDEDTHIDISGTSPHLQAITGEGWIPTRFVTEDSGEFVVQGINYWDGQTMESDNPSLAKIFAAPNMYSVGDRLWHSPGPFVNIHSGSIVWNLVFYTGTEAEPQEYFVNTEGYEHSLIYIKEAFKECGPILTSAQQATCGATRNVCVNQDLVDQVETWNADNVAFRAAAEFCGEDKDEDGYLPNDSQIINTMTQISFDLDFDALDRITFDCNNNDASSTEGIYYSLDLTCQNCGPTITSVCTSTTESEPEPILGEKLEDPGEEDPGEEEDSVSPINE